MRVHLIPVFDGRGQLIAGQGVFEDVSERNRALRAVRESEDRFRQIAEHTESGIFLIDYQGARLLYANRSLERILGESVENLQENANLIFAVIHPEDRDGVLEVVRGLEENESGEAEFRVLDATSGVRWVRASCFTVRDAVGRAVRVA